MKRFGMNYQQNEGMVWQRQNGRRSVLCSCIWRICRLARLFTTDGHFDTFTYICFSKAVLPLLRST